MTSFTKKEHPNFNSVTLSNVSLPCLRLIVNLTLINFRISLWSNFRLRFRSASAFHRFCFQKSQRLPQHILTSKQSFPALEGFPMSQRTFHRIWILSTFEWSRTQNVQRFMDQKSWLKEWFVVEGWRKSTITPAKEVKCLYFQCHWILNEALNCLDSGGPLVIKDGESNVQIGIVSFVSSRGCTFGDPSGYTKIGKYLSWISKETGIPTRNWYFYCDWRVT